MTDVYDEWVDYLTARPHLIEEHWSYATPLFSFVKNKNHPHGCPYRCGCLTLIRAGTHVAQTPELTAQIKADKRLPDDVSKITPDNLPVFAEWQRRIDQVLNRTPPASF